MIIYILPYSVEDISRHEYTMQKLNGDGIERTILLFSTRFTVENNTDQRILGIKTTEYRLGNVPSFQELQFLDTTISVCVYI